MGKRGRGEPDKAPNHERWLITYADLITLLMIFFVLMYTISNVNSKKFAQLADSMSMALIGQSSGYFVGEAPGPMSIDTQSAAADGAELESMKEAKEKLEEYIKENGLRGKVEVSQQDRGLIISLKEALLFNIGSAEITPQSRDVIIEVGKILSTLHNQIRIEGHTCNIPIHNSRFDSNWELSTARATNVVKFMISQVGIDPRKISATGYGEFRPIVPNTSEENRARNRRVDIVVLRTILNVAEPSNNTILPSELQDDQSAVRQ